MKQRESMSENASNVNKYAQGNENGGAMEGPNDGIEKTVTATRTYGG